MPGLMKHPSHTDETSVRVNGHGGMNVSDMTVKCHGSDWVPRMNDCRRSPHPRQYFRAVIVDRLAGWHCSNDIFDFG